MLISSIFIAMLAATMQPLWPSPEAIPDYSEDQIAAPSQDAQKPGFVRAEHRMPYLEWCDAPCATNRKDVCMMLISGGGYGSTCDLPSFRKFEKRFLDEGITCVYVLYRTPRPRGQAIYETAWKDGQRAVRLVRAAAKERGFDPEKIGAMGCSAGSHLSLLLATGAGTNVYAKVDANDDLPCHLNWVIPQCPAYVLSDGLGEPNATRGEGTDVTLDRVFRFDAKTCPACFFHGGNDPYSPLGSTRLYREWRKRNIPAELHLDAGRVHGVCKIERFERAIEFMRQMGYLGPVGAEQKLEELARALPAPAVSNDIEKIWSGRKMPYACEEQKYEPTIQWYLPRELKTRAVQIIFPGGGYHHCSMFSEGSAIAGYFNSKGMAAVVLNYRTPRAPGRAKHAVAWADAQRAIRLVRSEAPARGLDPDRIGVMGFSAGGHLALMCATSSRSQAYLKEDATDRVSAKVQWAFPVYPAYALTDGADANNTTGGNDDGAVLVQDFAFDPDTPPMCFNHGDADRWAAMNSVKCWEKLRRMGVQCDLHTYARRGHCFHRSTSPGTGSRTWQDRLWDFLSHYKFNH